MTTYTKKTRLLTDKGINEAYRLYRQDNKSPLAVTKQVYKKVIKECNKVLLDKILYESATFTLPYKLGELRIKKTRLIYIKSHLKIDWEATKRLGKRVYHLNEHRNGYRYRWLWRKKGPVINQSVYSFTPVRKAKRTLAYILKNRQDIDYFEQ